jgi:trehalose-phosphatase
MPAGEIARAAAAVKKLGEGRHLLLLLDFDGTLCEFNPDPKAVFLSDARRKLLMELHDRQDATIGIISGRRLEDVRRRARLPADNFHAGLHGLEIEGDGEKFEHPDVHKTVNVVRELVGGLTTAVSRFAGAFVEDKMLSVVAHYREVSPQDIPAVISAVESHVEPCIASGQMRIMQGASMIEILPNIDWNKGHAIQWIRERVASSSDLPTACVYVGDDVTDEDAFRAIRGRGLSVAASNRPSGADFVVDGPAEVEELLRRIV